MRISDWSSDVCSSDLGTRAGAHFLELLRRGIAVIGAAGRQQRPCQLGVVRGAGELVDHLAVLVEAEPGAAVEDRRDGLLGRALAVGVPASQPQAAALVAGLEPVKTDPSGAPPWPEAG